MLKTITIPFDKAITMGPQLIKMKMRDNGMVLYPHTQKTNIKKQCFEITSEEV
jgi:hypothetical protein